MKPEEARLRAALGSEDFAWLLKGLRRRYETGAGDASGTVTLPNPSPKQREACDRLLGRRPTVGGSLTVNLARLGRLIVEAELAPSLRDAIEVLTGPLIDRRDERRRTQAAWDALFDRYRSRVDHREAALQWYRQLQESGLLRRLAGGDADRANGLLERAVRVAERLPAKGVTLAQLAAECCGDSHALDIGQPVGTLTVRAAAAIGGIDDWRSAAKRRRAWDAVGVICDELSAPVLALNLPGTCGSLSSELLRLCASRGEPARVTMRQLLRHPPAFDPAALGGVVFICENANVVAAAADALGRRSRPLVCIDGQPTTASRLLLDMLRSAGVRLRYHGDFDWGGVRIANRIIEDHAAEPWRMSAPDYLTAAATGGRELTGNPVPAQWDSALQPAMSDRGIAVHEERILPPLLEDLDGQGQFGISG